MKKNSLGGIESISINIDAPLKLNIPSMNFNQVCILVGTNGSGKSILLKLNWVISYISESYLLMKDQGITNFNLLSLAQEAFDKSFTEQDFNGDINVNYKDGNDIVIKIEKGKVLTFDLKFDKELTYSGIPIFMSTNTRTYDDIQRYLMIRKSLGIIGPIVPALEPQFQQLSKMYKLYDLMFLERMYNSLMAKPLILSKLVKETLKDYGGTFDVESIGIDENKSDIYYINSKGISRSLTLLSKGEQSIINMFTAQEL